MVRGTLGVVRETLGEDQWTLSVVLGNLGEVRDGSTDPRGGSGRVGGPSWKVRDRLGLVG